MRKLVGALLAMTALMPVTASAQEGRRELQVEGEAQAGRGDGPGRAREERVREERVREQRGGDRAAWSARADAPRPDRGPRDGSVRGGPRDGAFDPGSRGDGPRRPRGDDRFAERPAAPPATGVGAGIGIGAGRADRDRLDHRDSRRADRDRFDRDRARGDRDGRGRNRSDWNRSDWGRSDWSGNDWDRSSFNDRGRRGDRWDRDWRRDARYDWNRYRGVNRGAYRLPRYYAPYGTGYGYRRFAVGVGLQSAFWTPDYWIDDADAYRLPPAWGPYRWVRYYDDALLVDLRSGVVIDAVYGIFW